MIYFMERSLEGFFFVLFLDFFWFFGFCSFFFLRGGRGGEGIV